jgi:hypothetical protein
VWALLLPLLLLASGPAAHADIVLRRGSAPPLQGDVVSITDDGVRIRTLLGAEQVVPWDRVREVQSSRTPSNLGEQMQRAESLWRARSRVERGDTELAEPLLERLFQGTRGKTGETALVVAEGLLRCRLARGEQVGALLPWLEVVRLRRTGVATLSYSTLPAILDEATLLAPALPPVLPAGAALERLRLELEAYGSSLASGADPTAGDPVVRALAQAYAAALVVGSDGEVAPIAELPQPPEGESRSVRDDPAVALLRLLLETAVAEPDARRAARQRLATLELASPWQSAWRHFFLGASLLRDADPVSRRRGTIELLHLPARSSFPLAWLSGVALRLAADELDRQGEASDAALLRRELETLHPHHPLRHAPRQPRRDAAPGPPRDGSSEPPAASPPKRSTALPPTPAPGALHAC